MRNQRASAFQIIATVGIIIAAFLLLIIMTVEKVKKDTISVQQYGKEYTGIIAEKGPEYAEKGAVQGAYQSIHETGPRGGYTEEAVSGKDHLSVFGNIEVAIWSRGQWINDKDKKIDITQTVTGIDELKSNMGVIVLDYLGNYTKKYGSIYAINLTTYNTSTIKIDEDKEFFMVATNPDIGIAKEYKVGGENTTDAEAQSARTSRVNVRYFELYNRMQLFIRNNIMLNSGWGAKNILNARISKTPSKPTGDTAALNPIANTARNSGGKTEYACAGQGNCAGYAAGTFTPGAADYCTASCPNLDSVTAVNYTACQPLTVPDVGMAIRLNLISGAKYINQLLNSQTPSSENVVCVRDDCAIKVPGSAPPTPSLDVSQDYYGAGWLTDRTTYKSGKYRWSINATGGPVDYLPATWEKANDQYTVLWWNQTESTGKATWPDGSNWLTDNPAAGNEWNEATFPQGMAACDSVNRQNCHTVYTGWCAEYHKKATYSNANCVPPKATDITPTCADWRSGPTNYYERSTDVTADDPLGHIKSDMDLPALWTVIEEYYTYDPVPRTATKYCCSTQLAKCACDTTPSCVGGPAISSGSCTVIDYVCNKHSKVAAKGKGYADFDGVEGRGKPTSVITHCDIDYTMQGKFKYRAETDILSTVTDMSTLIPVYSGTKTIQENPSMRAGQNIIVTAEPTCGDGCCDLDAEENLANSRYYCAADCTPPYKYCPVKKNILAQKTYYG